MEMLMAAGWGICGQDERIGLLWGLRGWICIDRVMGSSSLLRSLSARLEEELTRLTIYRSDIDKRPLTYRAWPLSNRYGVSGEYPSATVLGFQRSEIGPTRSLDWEAEGIDISPVGMIAIETDVGIAD